MRTKQQLYDLIEFQYDPIYCSFVKKQTHKTNVSKAIAYAEKKKIEFLRPASRFTRFIVALNGEKQYSLIFKEGREQKKYMRS